MNIKTELLKNYISDYINNQIDDFEIDANKIADTVATKMLSEIQEVLKNTTIDEIEMIEKIVKIFEKYEIDYGSCHDF